MKTFQSFIVEARKYTRTRSREDALKILQSKENQLSNQPIEE